VYIVLDSLFIYHKYKIIDLWVVNAQTHKFYKSAQQHIICALLDRGYKTFRLFGYIETKLKTFKIKIIYLNKMYISI
jgi:hypothetical protein